VPGFINDAHAALAEAKLEVILALEHRLAADGVCRGHPIVRTGRDVVGVAMFTKLALFHLGAILLQYPWSFFQTYNLRPGLCGFLRNATANSSFFAVSNQGSEAGAELKGCGQCSHFSPALARGLFA
jgi:hypothetical protein